MSKIIKLAPVKKRKAKPKKVATKKSRKKSREPEKSARLPDKDGDKACGALRSTCANPHCRRKYKEEGATVCPVCGRVRTRCRFTAGYKTTHPGVGHCYLHGGIRQPKLVKTEGKATVEYTEDTRLEALIRLVINRNNLAKTARETGIDTRTLRSWKNEDPKFFKRLAEMTRRDIADSCLRFAKAGFDRALRLVKDETKLYDVVRAAALGIDKAQLLTGEVTARTAHAGGEKKKPSELEEDEIDTEISALEEEIRATEREGSPKS